MATKTSEKISVQIGEEVTELQGDALAQFIKDRENLQAEEKARIAELKQKAEERAILLNRLGLTEDELKTILG